jgi:hypothetical protein
VTEVSAYPFGWPNMWLKLGTFAYLVPVLATSVLFGLFVHLYFEKSTTLFPKLYWLGLCSASLIIGTPFTRYFEIPSLIGVVLILAGERNSLGGKRLNLCVIYILIFEALKTLLTIL